VSTATNPEGNPAAPGVSRLPSLFAAVAVSSIILVLGVGLLLGLVIHQSVRDRAVEDAARTGEVAANAGALPFIDAADLAAEDGPLPAERMSALDAALTESLGPTGVASLNVWDGEQTLVYSTTPALVSSELAGADILARALAGDLGAEVVRPVDRGAGDEMLAVYVPIRAAGVNDAGADGSAQVIGVFEVGLPWEPIASAIRADTAKLWAALALGLAGLYLALMQFVRRAARPMRQTAQHNLYLATRDSLTGLANRDVFQDAVAERLRTATNDDGVDVVMMFNIDDFQTVNTTLGHSVGDELLQYLGNRLELLAGDEGTVGRVGGIEFGLLLTGVNRDDIAGAVAMYASALTTTVEFEGVLVDVTASVGVVPLDLDLRADVVLQRANIAMNEAKRLRTGVEEFHPSMDTVDIDALSLAGEIRAGIERNEFFLHYQPRYSLMTGEVTGAEALVRWNHPVRGLVLPGSFVPVAEQLPIGRALTDQILARAIEDVAGWHAQGIHVGVSVNLSTRDVADVRLAPEVETLLSQHGVDGRWLTLELTEDMVRADEGRTVATLSRLREIGCGVAIDDFGSGFASISYLVRLPATEVNIDRSFIDDLATDQQARKIVQHCVGVARSLGLTVTAKGIETELIEGLAADLGCETGQGYLRGKPQAPAELAEAILAKQGASPLPIGAAVPTGDARFSHARVPYLVGLVDSEFFGDTRGSVVTPYPSPVS